MAHGCGAKCAKFILIAFNIVFWLSGAAVLGVGLWLRLDTKASVILAPLVEVANDNIFYTATYVLIGIGAFVFLVGFLGCCGAITENKCMLGCYIGCLVVVFAVELAAGILAAVYKDKVFGELEKKLTDAVQNNPFYGTSGTYTPTAWGAIMNVFQNELECCGFNNASDYNNVVFGNLTTNPNRTAFPYSCCKLSEEGQTDPENPTGTDVEDLTKCEGRVEGFFFNQGCYMSVKDWIDSNTTIIIGVGIGIACIQLFGIIFAICLCRQSSYD